MSDFQPPPTYADVVLVEEGQLPRFNPVWLSWFLDLAGVLSASGGGGGSIDHNSTSGLQGGTSNQFYHLTQAAYNLLSVVAASTYTPTLTNVANLDASTAYVCQYIRIGANVVVSGKVDVDPTAGATLTQLGISLPVASNIGAQEDCAGTAFASGIAGQGAAIRGDAANNRAEMAWISADVTNQPMYFSFLYRII